MAEAMLAIDGGPKGLKAAAGFLVSFEWRQGKLLLNDHFPDVRSGDEPIASEVRAWELAAAFSHAMAGRICNVYVIHAEDFTPVEGYRSKIMRER